MAWAWLRVFPVAPMKLYDGYTILDPAIFIFHTQEVFNYIKKDKIIKAVIALRKSEKYAVSLWDARDYCIDIQDGVQPGRFWYWNGKLDSKGRKEICLKPI